MKKGDLSTRTNWREASGAMTSNSALRFIVDSDMAYSRIVDSSTQKPVSVRGSTNNFSDKYFPMKLEYGVCKYREDAGNLSSASAAKGGCNEMESFASSGDVSR